jgi:ATP-dependent Clp protease protease subunit
MTHRCPDRLVFLGQNLDNQIAEEVSAYLFLLDSETDADIQFYIECSRGSLSAGLTLYDAMQLVQADIATFCTGEASSLAALMLASGTKGKRTIHPSARVSLLPITSNFAGDQSTLFSQTNDISQMTDSLAFLLAQNTGRSQAQIQIDLETGLSLSAEEAVLYGLADAVMEHPQSPPSSSH